MHSLMGGALGALTILVSSLSQRSAVLALTTEFNGLQWPHNLPPHAKYWPNGDTLPYQKRSINAAGQQLIDVTPIAVRKMQEDEGEKFFMHYWQFPGTDKYREVVTNISARSTEDDPSLSLYINASLSSPQHPFNPPLRPHIHHNTEFTPNPHYRRSYLSYLTFGKPLARRAFLCPAGSNDCSSINRPNTCCNQGESCNIIPDTGLGDVGCCPPEHGCSGNLQNCDLGFVKCSDFLGGGCCIPRYVCVDVGCGPGPELASLLLTTLTATQTKLSNPASVTPSTSTTTTPTYTPTATSHVTTIPCSTGFQSCPSSLGGGCCRTDRLCGPQECPPLPTRSSSGSNTLLAPVRPTNNSPSSPTTALSTTLTATDCPQGFYQCNAFYRGGCCRIGRGCDTASCPATASSTVVSTNGVTVVVPTPGGTATISGQILGPTAPMQNIPSTTSAAGVGGSAQVTGNCANGWSLCPQSLSGGCCPTGFSCGIGNCQNTATATTGVVQPGAVVGKIAVGRAARIEAISLFSWTQCILIIITIAAYT